MDAWLSPDTLVASSTEETERLMVVLDEELRSSVMETAKESEPKKLGLGDIGPVSVNWIDGSGSVYRRGGNGEIGPSVSPSASVALRSPNAEESSMIDKLVSPDRMVASSTEETERLMVVFDEELRSSVMETAKESDPKKLGLGE